MQRTRDQNNFESEYVTTTISDKHKPMKYDESAREKFSSLSWTGYDHGGGAELKIKE